MAGCHTTPPAGGSSTHAEAGRSGAPRVVLAGNPNVGKSVVFAALTGIYVDVSNFPGTTVEITSGRLGEYEIVDTPGVYGVSDFNEEERVAKEVIVEGDIVVNVVDAVHLERDLFLTLQLIDMQKPLVVALNMADEARRRGVGVTAEQLSSELGVPVVETVAVEGAGIDELIAAIPTAHPGMADPSAVSDPLEASDEAYAARRARVNAITDRIVHEELAQASFSAKLSAALMHPLTGVPILIGLLVVMYYVLGVFVAGTVVGVLEETVMQGYYIPFVEKVVSWLTPLDSALGTILAGEFGVLTMAPTYLVGVILPLVAGFYVLLALLEDTGVLPRIAALTDRALTGLGLNGRAVIPLILGFGCVTMGTLTTRILGNRRERFIATALMAIAVPCSAQIAVIATLMASTTPVISAAYLLILFAIFVILGTLMNKIMPGEPTKLLIDLPSLRTPRADNVLRKSFLKVKHFMIEVSVFFVVGAAIVSTMDVTGLLDKIAEVARPLTVGWLGLPAEAARAFVMGFVRRDFGAAGFFSMDLSDVQLLVAMVTITLFVPCIASLMVVFKERGARYTAGLLAGSVTVAFVVGGIVSKVAGLL